jgi:hypothetical protein
MEDWKKNLGELLNEYRFFPFDEWNKQIDTWAQEWVSELNRRTGVRANFQLSSEGKKVLVSFNGEAEFIIYLKYVPIGPKNKICLRSKYTVQHSTIRKFKAVMKGDEDIVDEEKDYKWLNEDLTLSEGPILEKGFVLQTLNIVLRKWLQRSE